MVVVHVLVVLGFMAVFAGLAVIIVLVFYSFIDVWYILIALSITPV